MKKRKLPSPRSVGALRSGEVSELTTNRLSVYLRCLNSLVAEQKLTVSSQELAERFHLNSAQIRKDLANFGEFGIRGVGYDVVALRDTIVRILGLDREKSIIIVGAGNLGLALADYDGFNSGGFRIVNLIDSDPEKVGMTSRSGVPVASGEMLPAIVRDKGVEIAILAVPPASAQAAYDRLCDAGIEAILNFAPVRINLRPNVRIKSVDLKISLEALSFHLTRKRTGKRSHAKAEGTAVS